MIVSTFYPFLGVLGEQYNLELIRNAVHEKKSRPFHNYIHHGCYEDFYMIIIFVVQAFVIQ